MSLKTKFNPLGGILKTKEEYTFVQPTLSENGYVGGYSFAMESDSYYQGHQPYMTADGVNNTFWQSNTTANNGAHWITVYNPEPLKVTKVEWDNLIGQANYNITGGYIQGSNDNLNWDNLGTIDNVVSANAHRQVLINTSNYYRCIRFYITSWQSTTAAMRNIQITATYSSDQESEIIWAQPTLTANGTLGGDTPAVAASRTAQSTTAAYRAFDKNSSTRWGGGTTQYPVYITIYNPIALKVANVSIMNYWARTFTKGDILAGDDPDNLITLVSNWTNSNSTQNAVWTINVNSSSYYKYWRINFTAGGFSSSQGQSISEVYLDARIRRNI